MTIRSSSSWETDTLWSFGDVNGGANSAARNWTPRGFVWSQSCPWRYSSGAASSAKANRGNTTRQPAGAGGPTGDPRPGVPHHIHFAVYFLYTRSYTHRLPITIKYI